MDILGAVDGKKDGAKLTKIMYESSTNCVVLKKNLGVAFQRGDLKECRTSKGKRFTLSDQGARAYDGWRQYEEFSKELEKLGIKW